MRAHYLQHVPFEGLGSIQTWLTANGSEITRTQVFESVRFPQMEDFDLLIIMGGPMSVNDEAELPWLVAEKAFIRQSIAAGKCVLGICLGAQLIATVLGARVYANGEKEIGWLPVHAVPAAGEDTFQFPDTLNAFHWHGETFELPAGAVHLAESAACRNQAFQFGRKVIGLQFHLETTPESAWAIIDHSRSELVPAPYVQSEASLLATAPERYEALNDAMADVLSYLRAAHG